MAQQLDSRPPQPRIPKQMTMAGAERVLVEFLTIIFAHKRFITNRLSEMTDEDFAIDPWAGRKAPQVVNGFIPRNVTGVIDPQAIPDYPAVIVTG
jgi:hypothetical protein